MQVSQDAAPVSSSKEEFTIGGLIQVRLIPELVKQSLRFSQNTEFNESLRMNVDRFGMAFIDPIFWDNLQKVFNSISHHKFVVSLTRLDRYSESDAIAANEAIQ